MRVHRLLMLCSPSLAYMVPCRPAGSRRAAATIAMQHSKGWDGFGKGPFKFYEDFETFMKPFPAEDREAYPEMFRLPTGVYEVAIERPLGISFEEVAPEAPKGVVVDFLVEGGNAELQGVVKPGDILIAATACKEFGPRWERKLLPTIDMEFDIIMSAIGSNQPRWKAYDVVMQFMRPSEADEKEVRAYLKFFDIPYDHVFRTG